jgi:hypothetical protein
MMQVSQACRIHPKGRSCQEGELSANQATTPPEKSQILTAEAAENGAHTENLSVLCVLRGEILVLSVEPGHECTNMGCNVGPRHFYAGI